MIYNNFDQVKWIINAIYTNDDYLIIHIDKKADYIFAQQIQQYIGNRPYVKFLTPRPMRRFGWSIVETELQAIRVLVDYYDDWKYVVNLSGQDYPIKPINDIRAKLIAEWPKNFIEVIAFSKMAERDPDDAHLARRLAFEIFGTVVTTRIRLPFPRTVDVKYKGSQWFMLTRIFANGSCPIRPRGKSRS